jgi:hypothetical protein
VQHSVHHDRSAFSSLEFTWHQTSALPSTPTISESLVLCHLCVLNGLSYGESWLFFLRIDGILQVVSSLASPRRLHYPRWRHGRPVQQHEPIAVLRTCKKPEDDGLRHCLHGKAAWIAHDLKIRLFERRRGTRTIDDANDDCRPFGNVR